MKTHKTLGKLLIVALFVVLFVTLLTVSASAATHDVTDEATLTEALTNAAAGDTINVTADITLTQAVTLSKQLTFEGNGKTISRSDEEVFYLNATVTFNNLSVSGKRPFVVDTGKVANLTYNGGTLTATDRVFHTAGGSLTANVSGTAESPVTVNSAHAVCGEGSGTSNVTFGANTTVTLSGFFSHFQGSTTGTTTVDGATVTCSNVVLYCNGTTNVGLTVNSGSITAAQYILKAEASANATVTINGGRVHNSNNQGIVNFSTGKVDFIMTGGEYNNVHSDGKNQELFWYDKANTTVNTIRITGGKVIGGYFHLFGNTHTNIEIGGTAEIEFVDGGKSLDHQDNAKGDVTITGGTITTNGWTITYEDSASGNVSISGNAKLISSSFGIVYNNGIKGTVNITGDAEITSGSGNQFLYFSTKDPAEAHVANVSCKKITGGGIYMSVNTKLTFSGNTEINLTGAILLNNAKAKSDFVVKDNVKITHTNCHAFDISNGCTINVTLQDNVQVISNSTSNDKETFNIITGANPTIYVKDNVKIETPDGKWGHIFRVGTDAADDATANATIYVQGSTKAGDKGVDLDGHRILDIRTRSDATLIVSGKVDLNADGGIVKANDCTNTVDITMTGNDISMTVGNDIVFQIRAKAASITMDGNFTVDCNTKSFIYYEVRDPALIYTDEAQTQLRNTISLTGSFTITNCGRVFDLRSNSSEIPVDVDLTGNFDLSCSDSIFYVASNIGRVDIDVAPRTGNTTDKFVVSTWRLINFRENTVVDLSIISNEIDVTTTERIAYSVGCTDIDLTFKASDITFTTLGTSTDTDCFFLFNGYASGKKANINFDGKVSLINASIGTDHEKNPDYFGCWGTNAENVVLGLTLHNMDVSNINWLNWEDSTEFSYGTPIVLENCTGTLTIGGTFTAPQIHVKGGSVSTVITGTANLSGLGSGTLQGGLVYSNGATGSITVSGNGVLNHKGGHGIEINGCNTTVTIKDSASIISAATTADMESVFIVNNANATVYLKDNATIFSPDSKWGHAFRIGANTDLDKTSPASATIYIQGSTAEGDEGIDIDVCRLFDVRNNNSLTFEITGKVDINVDAGVVGAHATTQKVHGKILGDNITFTNGNENMFKFDTKDLSFVMEGNFVLTTNDLHIFTVYGQSASATHKHTVSLTGNFIINTGKNTAGGYASCFYVENTGTTPVEITVNARKNNTTDKLVFDGDRLFNIRKNVKFTCNIKTNEVTTTTTERVAYTVDTAALAISIEAPVINHTSDCNGDALYLFNKSDVTNIKNVSLTLKGAVTATCAAYTNLFQIKFATDFTLNVIGALTASVESRIVQATDCTGKITVKLEGDINIPQTTDIVYIKGASSADVDLIGNFNVTATGSAVYIENVAGKSTVDIAPREGNTTDAFNYSGWRLTNLRENTVTTINMIGKGTISSTEKVMYHVGCSSYVTIDGSFTIQNTAGTDWAFIYFNNGDGVAHKGSLTLKGDLVLNAKNTGVCVEGTGATDVDVTVTGNVVFNAGSQAIYFATGASGSMTVSGNATINAAAIRAEGAGNVDLTVSGTPTLTFTSTYNGIQHVATGEADISLSGVWSTNKTIYLSGGKKNVTVSGADTVLTLGGSGFYAENCETTLTVQGGAINYTANDAMFIAVSGGKMDVTVNSGTLSSAKYFGHAYTASTLNLTVNGGTLSSGSWFLYYGKNGEADQTATGTVAYNGGTINAKDHNLVNFGNKKVDFTMTGGTVTAPNSFVYYENQTATDAEMSTIRITGGSHTGGHFYVVKKAAANVTVGGNANLNITSGWAFRFQGTATGSVTLEGNSAITVNDHGFVNNSAGKVDFTIKDNASLTSTKHTTVYYGGSYADGVVNEIKILGGTLTAVQQAVIFPGSGGQFKLTMSGGSLNTTSDGMAFGGTFTGNINISGGSIYSTSNNLYFNGNGTYTVNISGGSFTCPSNDCIELVNKDTTTFNMTISGGTFHTLGTNYPIVFTGKNNTLTITGGSFIADNAHAALHVAQNATATVYGGYFEGGALCAARACDNGTLNIYGGEFYYNASVSTGGMPIRSGTTGTVGTVNIYGGNYRTDGTAPIFYCINDISHLTVYGGYNAYGGGTLIVNDNKTNGGTPTRGMPIGSIVDSDSIYMVEGAAVRIVEGSSGLRFKAKINASSYNFIAGIADAGSIRFGTLIAPVDYVQQADRFTKAELDRLGLSYLNLPANAGLKQLEDGSYEISAAITNIKEANRGREFAAVAYMIYTVDGHEVITYATFRENKNARSIEQVARLALQDGRRYNENQLNILNALAPTTEAPVIDLYLIAGQSNAAGSTRFSEAFRDSDPAFTEGYPNIYYSGTAAGGSAYVSKNFVEIELAKAGFGNNPTSGMGAELGMAKALSQYYNEETGRTAAIVKYGYGGTALADSVGGQNFPEGSWCPPSWLAEHGKKDEQKSGGLYRAFVAQIQSSINDYRAMGYEVNIVAAYWMQGESDRNNKNYAAMFEAWVNDLRADVYKLTRDSADKKLPVLVGEISYSYNPGDMHLNAPFIQMQNQMAEQIDNLYVINQSPLATANTRSDTGHWSCDDMLLIGQMVATTALNELVLGDEDEKLEMPYLVGTPVAEVYDAEGTLLGTYSSFSWAINTAPAGATVKLLDDLTIYGPLGINNPNKITVDGGDFMIDVRSDLGETMKLIATDLTLKDFNIIAHAVAFNGASDTVWGLQTYNGAKLVWNGGSFEAESIGIVLNDAAVVQLHNVDVSVRNGVEGHSAAIYMGDKNADLWVNGGTVTGIGKAEAIRAATGYVTVSGGAVIVGGTNTAWAISQRSGEGYLAIGNDVTVTGNILNNGDGYLAGEDVVVLPSPEVPEEPAPELPVEPAPEVPVEPAPEVPEQPAPEVPEQPAPEVPEQPAPEITIDPAA